MTVEPYSCGRKPEPLISHGPDTFFPLKQHLLLEMGAQESRPDASGGQGRILMLGLDGAGQNRRTPPPRIYVGLYHILHCPATVCTGKTTILYALKLGETIETVPTVGFNIEVGPQFSPSRGHACRVALVSAAPVSRVRGIRRR